MEKQAANTKMIAKLMMKLLPIQILLAAVTAVNGIVSSFCASNFISVDSMSAIGLYGPINMLITAINMTMVGGSVILCGKYMGQFEQEKMRNVFSLSLVISAIIGIVFTVLFVIFGAFDLTGFLAKDPVLRPLFNQYLLGMSIGVFPLVVGNQLQAFLSMENKGNRTLVAIGVYIFLNIVLNFLFVLVLKMEIFGLALASSIGLWAFFLVQAPYFFSKKSHLKFSMKGLAWKESGAILRIGFPAASARVYETIRGLIVNALLLAYVGSVALSAFAAVDSLLRIFWAIPFGMQAVSRMLMSVSVGEEDRRTLADIMRVMFTRYVPLMCAVSALLIIFAVPLTRIFYRDPADPVYMMTVWGLRLIPVCMPLSTIAIHFINYGQASGKDVLVNILSLFDGAVFVAGFTALLIPALKMNSVYIANILNGVGCILICVIYALIRKKHFPRSMDDLMVIPDDFGVTDDERMDLSIRSIEDVVTISQRVQAFCEEKGIDAHRSYLAGLAMEEMAGNIVDHGFTKDKKKHSVDVRVVHKDNDLILRLKDDCVPFDPRERQKIADPDDVTKNIGLRMIFKMAEDIQYQNILGLNVLTIKV